MRFQLKWVCLTFRKTIVYLREKQHKENAKVQEADDSIILSSFLPESDPMLKETLLVTSTHTGCGRQMEKHALFLD